MLQKRNFTMYFEFRNVRIKGKKKSTILEFLNFGIKENKEMGPYVGHFGIACSNQYSYDHFPN